MIDRLKHRIRCWAFTLPVFVSIFLLHRVLRSTRDQTSSPQIDPTTGVRSTHHPRVDAAANMASKKTRSRLPGYLVAMVLVTVTLSTAAVGYGQYRLSRGISAIATAPGTDDGGILLLFGHPHETIRVTYYVSRTGRFSITAESKRDSRSDFLAIYSAQSGYLRATRGRHSANSRIQSVLDIKGKSLATLASVDGDPPILRPPPPHEIMAVYSFPTYDPELAIVDSGIGTVAQRGSASSGDDVVYGQFPPVVSTAPASEAGSLPLVVTPGDIRETSSVWHGYVSRPIGGVTVEGRIWYPPEEATVETIVDYNHPEDDGAIHFARASTGGDGWPLPAPYQLERTYPTTVDDSQLRWVQERMSRVNWLVRDQDATEAGTYHLFLAGLLLGASFGFLASAMERLADLRIKRPRPIKTMHNVRVVFRDL